MQLPSMAAFLEAITTTACGGFTRGSYPRHQGLKRLCYGYVIVVAYSYTVATDAIACDFVFLNFLIGLLPD